MFFCNWTGALILRCRLWKKAFDTSVLLRSPWVGCALEMETIGFEPMTLCVQSIRSTNWTTSPYGWQDSNLYDHKAPGPKPGVSTNFTTPAYILTRMYHCKFETWVIMDSNHWPFRCKRIALPTELITLSLKKGCFFEKRSWPDEGGFEPPILLQYAGFQDRYLKPLRHSSFPQKKTFFFGPTPETHSV